MPRPLPDRPNLEQLKKQAKSLLHAARARDTAALASLRRVAGVCRQIDRADRRRRSGAARRAVRDRARARFRVVERRCVKRSRRGRSSFDAAVDEFVRCATGGASGRAQPTARAASRTSRRRHCKRHWCSVMPRRSDARLRDDPALATQAGGPQNWEPLLYVCHTCMHVDAPSRVEGLVAIARGSARSGRIQMPSITGTGIPNCRARRCGARSARSGICRSRRCCSKPARIRPTASRRTSPAAAATSPRSSCCTATAST